MAYFCRLLFHMLYRYNLLAFLLFTLPLFAQESDRTLYITGTVTDRSNEALPGATIMIYPTEIRGVTDEKGHYFLRVPHQTAMSAEVRFLGYHTVHRHVYPNATDTIELHFQLSASEQLLETVQVSEQQIRELQSSQSMVHADRSFLAAHGDIGLSNTLARLPGIQVLTTGVGISKPVIRGLSNQRIIILNNDIKQESHQWGSDHGLSIDPFSVDRVQVIQGPASLKYGSDGLGGAVRLLPDPTPPMDKLEGSIALTGQTNQEHWGGSVRAGINKRGFYLSGRLSLQSFGDYRVPAESFEYRSRVYPIENGRLKNTAGREHSYALHGGYIFSGGSLRLGFQEYRTKVGFFPGIIGAAGAYAITDDGDSRNIELPRQEVIHRSYNAQWNIEGSNGMTWKLDAGFQQSHREELSYPEFHLRPETEHGFTALKLDLNTFSLDAQLDHQKSSSYPFTQGIHIQHQQNNHGGFDFLLPGFNTLRIGTYHMTRWNLSRSRIIEAGLRVDYAHNRTQAHVHYLYASSQATLPSDSLSVMAMDNSFFNWSASAGYIHPFIGHRGFFKAHWGKSFRVPYPNETSSNGIHHGSFRHELGNPDLVAEHGYQLDAVWQQTMGKVTWDIKGYAWFFKNFIYLSPSAMFSPLPEAGQMFRYEQHNAWIHGAELSWRYNPFTYLSLGQGVEWNYTYNIELKRPLPFSPPLSMLSHIRWGENGQRDESYINSWYVQLEHRYTAAQNRVVQNERSTDAYHLWDAGAGVSFNSAGRNIQINFQARNLLNRSYINHLSNYKLITLPEQGRNFVLAIRIPVEIALR